jgi:hypothetical protein
MSARHLHQEASDRKISPAQKLLADDSTPPPEKKVSSKVTKAQRRAQQAEFNRQLWAEACVHTPSTIDQLDIYIDYMIVKLHKRSTT